MNVEKWSELIFDLVAKDIKDDTGIDIRKPFHPDYIKSREEIINQKGNNVDKCEWKNNLPKCCSSMSGALISDDMKVGIDRVIFKGAYIDFCPFCGADIRKPEPKQPIIKKSGGTWVGFWEGIDYLCMKTDIDRPEESFKRCIVMKANYQETWKPILEMEITDEIAKLRPKVIVNSDDSLRKLVSITNNIYHRFVVISASGESETWTFARLATVSDLEES